VRKKDPLSIKRFLLAVLGMECKFCDNRRIFNANFATFIKKLWFIEKAILTGLTNKNGYKQSIDLIKSFFYSKRKIK
jgi:hypothetical protein